jgi:DNA mismatch repair protein MutS2
VENACCEFDVATLRPTYRLLIGVPGKSNAFAISRKLGLPEEIIEGAKKHLTEEAENFEDVISDLENRRLSMEQAEDEISRNRDEIKGLRDSLAARQKRLEDSREKILDEARQEAARILRETKAYADETIRNYNKYGGSANAAREMERERSRLREKMAALEKSEPKKPEKSSGIPDPANVRVGDRVHVNSMNLDGNVLSLPDSKGNLLVQMGILHSQVSLKDITLIESAPEKVKASSATGAGKVKMSKSASVSTEINLLGLTVDEALMELDKYLDDAYLAHLPSVRVVHGKGTGALRKAVHNYLRRQKHVKSFRLGEFGEGDSGVTIVSF